MHRITAGSSLSHRADVTPAAWAAPALAVKLPFPGPRWPEPAQGHPYHDQIHGTQAPPERKGNACCFVCYSDSRQKDQEKLELGFSQTLPAAAQQKNIKCAPVLWHRGQAGQGLEQSGTVESVSAQGRGGTE